MKRASQNRRLSVDAHNIARLESRIADLGRSIQISPRHRQRTLSQVSDSTRQKHGKKRAVWVYVYLSVALVLVSPLSGWLSRVESVSPQTSQRVQNDALQRAETSRLSFEWALADVFAQFRERKRINR